MTDLPPRPPPPRPASRTDGRSMPDTRRSPAVLWVVFLVVVAIIIAAVAFSLNRRDATVIENQPVATEPATTGTGGTATTDPETVDPLVPAPEGEVVPAPDGGGTTTP